MHNFASYFLQLRAVADLTWNLGTEFHNVVFFGAFFGV